MLEILVVIICLLLNSFFAAFEMAFVTVTKEDFSDTADKFRADIAKIFMLKKNPERTLSVIQIGISLVGAISAAVGGNGAVESFSPILESSFGLSPTMAEALSVLAVILPLTYLSVVFGELVPKTIALNNPKPILFYGIGFLSILDKIFSPVITFLEVSTSFVLKKLRIQDSGDEVDSQSSVTISYLPLFHQKFVINLIELHHRKALDSMVKWDTVVKLNFHDEESQVLDIIKLSAHTRFPVIDGDVVVGILHAKEFYADKRSTHQPWQSIIRSVQTFKSNEKLLNIFVKLQEKKQHLAIISNVEGEFLGIITLEDIIEEIVGDIFDEVEDTTSLKMLLSRTRIPIKSSR
jgi:putative hemolysin